MVLKIDLEDNMNNRSRENFKGSREAIDSPTVSRESNNDSVPQLIDRLCARLCEDLNESSSIRRRKIVKKLKVQAFQILLKTSPSTFNKDCNITHKDELIAMLVDQIYFNSIQSSSWTTKKNQEVQRLVDKLSVGFDEEPYIGNCIKFLLCMSESVPLTSSSKIQSRSFELGQQRDSYIRSLQSLSGVNEYNTKVNHISPIDRKSSDYQPSLFDTNMMIDNPLSSYNSFSRMTDIKDFPSDSQPGVGLKLFEKFSSLWTLNDKNSGITKDFSNNQRMNTLSIPELNLDVPRSLTIPSMRSSHLDEGYVTPDKEYLDEHDKDSFSKKSNFDIWKTLTTYSINEPSRYTWESLGKVELNKELPFLLQSDLDVIECWKKHSRVINNYNTVYGLNDSEGGNTSTSKLEGERSNDEYNTLSHKEFFRDVKCLLIAVNTKTFYFDEVLNTFTIKPDVCLPGITPEGLEVYSKDLIECGNNFRLLDLLAKRNCLNDKSVSYDINCTVPTNATSTSSINTTCNTDVLRSGDVVVNRGLVFEAMCSSICCWLQAYRGVVIKMIDLDSNSLLDVKLWLHPLQQQLRLLVNLCCPSSPDFNLPSGGALLTHIYNVVQVTIAVPFSYILYNILENCLKVYFRFVENWLFEGICDDIHGEFFVEQKNSYEVTKDRSYWKRTFFIRHERVPVFLKSLVNDIFVCGKTLNLVKFCNPNDPFCQRLENIYPRMSPCFEEGSLNRLIAEYHKYGTSCENVCTSIHLTNIFSPGFDSDEDKESRFNFAGQQRAKSLDKIKKVREDRLKKKDEEKRLLFEERKNDMLEAKKRKVEIRQKELEDDKKRLDVFAKEAEVEALKKAEEREKVIQFYKSLSNAADSRKSRAEWKIKRLKLNDKRIDFLVNDKIILKDELLKYKQEQFNTNTVAQSENNQDNLTLNERITIKHSACSSSSWLTCRSLESGLIHTNVQASDSKNCIVGKDEKSSHILANDTEDICNDYLKSGSFCNLLPEVSCKENYELKPNSSSSDTNIYGNLNNHNTNNKNMFLENGSDDNLNDDAKNVNDQEMDIVKSTGCLPILKGIDDSSPKETVVARKLIKYNMNEKSFTAANDSKNIASLFKQSDLNKTVSVEEIFSSKTVDNKDVVGDTAKKESEQDLSNIDFDYNYEGDEKQVVCNKIFSDARNAALLNKQKVNEDEYGINDIIKTKMNEEKDNVKKCKDEVIEMKMKLNETAIKERTEQLALACSNFVESRIEAARNKARVMNSEYSIISSSSGKRDKEQINKTVSDISVDRVTNRRRKVSGEKKSVLSVCNDNKDNSSSISRRGSSCGRSETDGCKKTEHNFSLINSEFVDSSGQFIMDKKPIIIDIADKCLSHKQDSLLLMESANNTTIHYCLYKSVEIPMEIQRTFTNDAILRLFIVNEKLLDHLQCIRKYFFLLDGEYGRTLTRHLFTDLENVEQPSAFLTYLRLNSILRSAIRSQHSESPLMERLSFFVRDTPLVFVLTDPEVLNCLSMRYRVHWPLNIILTNDGIIYYDRIFAFQLKLQRAAWALEQDMQLLKMKNMMKSGHYRQLQIFRHGMTHFVRAISNYIVRIALEESWIEFKNNLSKADNLDALYSAHVEYVKMILFRCLLNKRSETIQKTIIELLRKILCFHELLRTGEWVYDLETGNHTHSAFARLSHCYTAFVRVLRYLVKYINQVICRGYQPHLDVLITFLSGNEFYSEEV